MLTLTDSREQQVAILLAALALFVLLALSTSRKRNDSSPLASVITTEREAATPGHVAHGWARAAVAFDFARLAGFIAMAVWIPSSTFSLAPREGEGNMTSVVLTLPIALLAAVGLFRLGSLLHRRATKPPARTR
ncbi:hypothetical protein ABR737_01260 [Streptomyces sp. Edi2]|uniref:hypothetical protein n=1 Tax=Streptomyces sp. Edi2 TaxID=3162528 RepID=UPI0033058849